MSVYVENFKTTFSVKNNIKALRNKVLELAIQGKLVEQDLNDEPALELVKKIKIKIDKLWKEGIIKKEKLLEQIKEDEIPFVIPDNWYWVKCGEIFNIKSASRIHQTDWRDSGIPFYRGRELVKLGKCGTVNSEIFIEEDFYDKLVKKSGIPKANDLLVSAVGTIGKVYIVKKSDKFYYKDAYILCFENYGDLDAQYIEIMLESDELQKQIKTDSKATTVAQLTIFKANNLLMPIPPLKEQQRIVFKVEYLMSEIDKLEESLRKKEHLMEMLPKAVVDAIGNCQTGEELKVQLQFVIENFKIIFQTPESMQELRNVVLQLAIEGKLVPQDSTDEPASELIKRIQIEKNKLVKEGKIKKQKPLPPIEKDEIPFGIPERWKWMRFGDVAFNYDGNRVPLSKEIRDNLDKRYDYYGASGIIDKVDKYLFDRPLLLIGEDGANLVTRSKPIAFIATGKYWVNNHAHVLDFIDNHLMDYVRNFINAIDLKPYVTGTAQPKMNQEKMNSILISVPPMDEIIRINKQIQSIMSLIVHMESELKRKVDLVEKMASV